MSPHLKMLIVFLPNFFPPRYLSPQVVLVVKNLPGDPRDAGSIPESERSPGIGSGNPPQYSCLENSMDRGAWWATVHGLQGVGHIHIYCVYRSFCLFLLEFKSTRGETFACVAHWYPQHRGFELPELRCAFKFPPALSLA